MAEQKREPGSEPVKSDASAYASTKAPETQDEANERVSTPDARLIPGGAHAAHAEIGMSAMDRSDLPSGAQKPEQLDISDSPEGSE